MNVINKIKEASVIQIISAIFGVLILLIGSIYSDVLPLILPTIIQKLPKPILLKITTLAILLCVLSIALTLTIYLKLRIKFTAKCGVLWDKDKIPYCPSCKTLLSEYCIRNPSPHHVYDFRCYGCDINIRLMDNGENISLQDAQKLLK